MAIFIPKMKRHSEPEFFCFGVLFFCFFLFIFRFDFVVVDVVVVDDVNLDIVVVVVAVVVVFLFFFYLTLMAGPVLTILLDIFFSPGLSYSSTVVQAVTHTHTHTHIYRHLNMHTLTVQPHTHIKQYLMCDATCGSPTKSPSSSSPSSTSSSSCLFSFYVLSLLRCFHTPWVHSTSHILQGKTLGKQIQWSSTHRLQLRPLSGFLSSCLFISSIQP